MDRWIYLTMYKLSTNHFPAKITALWTVFLLGTLFHTQLALMPLFHGQSIAESHTDSFVSMDVVLWLMLIFFVLPMVAIVGCALHPTRQFCKLHFGLTLVYTVLNLMHLVMDAVIAVPSYQLVLMGLLLGIGLLLNLVSEQWLRALASNRYSL